MNNIGYAVFGSPKGLAVVSNGLFKTLNLDKSLYLNNVHVVLEIGDQVLMIRRIPSNTGNLEKKDGLLIALYENALQHSENRAGGFVGSAICFKNQMPNADELISGLVYLFSKMKENVDTDNRFKAIDSSGWNINLPDVKKTFGLEESKLVYAPMSSTITNVVVNLNNLKNEAASILYNFALNSTFHSTDYVYASESKKVVDNIKANGFIQITFAEFFNYNKHLNSYKERQIKDIQKLSATKIETEELDKKKVRYLNEVKTLENKIASGGDHFNDLGKKIIEAETKLKKINKEAQVVASKSRSSNNRLPQVQSSNVYGKEYNSLKRTVEEASKKIQKHSALASLPNSNNLDDYNKSIVDRYFNTLSKRKSNTKKLLIGLLSTILILVIIILFLIFKTPILDESTPEISNIEQESESEKENDAEALKIENSNKRLANLETHKKNGKNPNLAKFKKSADALLKEYLDGKTYPKENKYIVDYEWEFYEFDFMNVDLVKKLSQTSKNSFFISLKNLQVRERRDDYLLWKGDSGVSQVLDSYRGDNDNDIYEHLPINVIDNTALMEYHFIWVIKEENSNFNEGSNIRLPFTEKNNT